MALELIRVSNLRCLGAVELSLDRHWNFIVGANGAGKTSLLEAVHVAGRARSFRTRQNRRLVRHGSDSFVIYAEIADMNRTRRLGIECGRGALELRLDGSSEIRATDLAEILPVHVLDPGAHALIDAGPSERRRYVDWGVFHVEQGYLAKWRAYRRVLSQRNAALKDLAQGPALDVWTQKLIEAGNPVDSARRRYVDQLAKHVDEIGEHLLGVSVAVQYRPGWSQAETFEEALESSLARDRQMRATQVGPHRADLSIKLAEARVRDAASRGQQKLVAAALVLGQVRTFAATGRDPGVLLVDDPAAELDEGALRRFMSELAKLPAQRILTGLTKGPLEPLPGGKVFHVEQGSIKKVYNVGV